jgi:hypothetical protein
LILLLAGLLVACSGDGHCPPGSGPEGIKIDASAYADLGTLRICIGDGIAISPPDNCFDDGTSVETTLDGEYPQSYPYEIHLIEGTATDGLLKSGTVNLSCDAIAITVSFD